MIHKVNYLYGYDLPRAEGKAVRGLEVVTIYVPMERDHPLGLEPSWYEATKEQAAKRLRVEWRRAELTGKDSAEYWILAIERTFLDGMQIGFRQYRVEDDGRAAAIRDVAGIGRMIQEKYPKPIKVVGGRLLDRNHDAEITAQNNRGEILRIIPDELDREEAGCIWGGRYVEGYLLADGRIIFAGDYVREALHGEYLRTALDAYLES